VEIPQQKKAARLNEVEIPQQKKAGGKADDSEQSDRGGVGGFFPRLNEVEIPQQKKAGGKASFFR
jgi:hypothetical protein